MRKTPDLLFKHTHAAAAAAAFLEALLRFFGRGREVGLEVAKDLFDKGEINLYLFLQSPDKEAGDYSAGVGMGRKTSFRVLNGRSSADIPVSLQRRREKTQCKSDKMTSDPSLQSLKSQLSYSV